MTTQEATPKNTVREFEGDVFRQNDSYKLASADTRSSHPLNLKSGTLDAHHIISDMVVNSLATFRTLQMQRKGWSMNHGTNLVLLSSDEQICCYYETPQHSSGHTDSNIANSFYGSKAKMLKESSKIQDKKLKKSIDSTIGYHKVVAIKLALTLNKLNCDTDYLIYVDEVDDVSKKILGYISNFKLLLKGDGARFNKGQIGCGVCTKRDAHFTPGGFEFFNKRRDLTERDEHTRGSGGMVKSNITYQKNNKEYSTSVKHNMVYENIYKRVEPKEVAINMIFDRSRNRLKNVKEL